MQRPDMRTEELLAALAPWAGKRVFVAVLGSPDPDGLGSAWALQLLARHVGVTMDILTFEVVSRPDNTAFCQLLAIPFRQVVGQLPRVGYAAYAVVDRQNARLPVPVRRKLPLIAHIDHHAAMPTGAKFAQQDHGFGSTSSIMAFHLADLAGRAKQSPLETCRVATALMYGIRTDTQDFLNARAVDFEAAACLAPLVSTELVRTVVLTPLGRPFLDTLGHALMSLVTKNGFTVAWAGKVGRRARDTIGQCADFLARGEGTVATVVFGLVNGNLNGSLRCSDPNLDTYQFLDEALSRRLGFPVDCGGRTFSGGFAIPREKLAAPDDETAGQIVTGALLDAWAARGPRRRRTPRPDGQR